MFDLQTEQHGNMLIMRLHGSVLISDAIAFDRQLATLTASAHITQAVLDLSEVKAIDRAGLGVLVSMSTRYRGRGRRLVLLSPAPHVVQLLQETKIEGFFPTFYNEEELKGTIPSRELGRN